MLVRPPTHADIADSTLAFLYARNEARGRFPAGELALAKSATNAYLYAAQVLHTRFPAGEPVLAKNARLAYFYAIEIIKARFIAGEPAIMASPGYSYAYENWLRQHNAADYAELQLEYGDWKP